MKGNDEVQEKAVPQSFNQKIVLLNVRGEGEALIAQLLFYQSASSLDQQEDSLP